MFKPDKWQEAALKTWYPVDNPLHLDPRHPCIKLAGEAGEILDLYGKHEYKPGFDWWDCKHCRTHYDYDFDDIYQEITNNKSCDCNVYTPLILDELGDYSYYLRILAYQKEVTFDEMCKSFEIKWFSKNILVLLADLSSGSSTILWQLANDVTVLEVSDLTACCHVFLAILDNLNTPLVRVLELNRQKLHTPEMNGWKNAR